MFSLLDVRRPWLGLVTANIAEQARNPEDGPSAYETALLHLTCAIFKSVRVSMCFLWFQLLPTILTKICGEQTRS